MGMSNWRRETRTPGDELAGEAIAPIMMQSRWNCAWFPQLGLKAEHRKRSGSGTTRRRHAHGTRPVIFLQLFHAVNLVAGCVLGLFHARAMNLDPVANLDAGRVAFEGIALGFAGLQFEAVRSGDNTSTHGVMAAVNGDHDDEGNDCACPDSDTDHFPCSRPEVATRTGGGRCCARAEKDGEPCEGGNAEASACGRWR